MQLWPLRILLLRFLYLIKEIGQSQEKKQFLFTKLLIFEEDRKRMTRKLEKKRYELFPYAGIGIISCNTIHSLLIFDLNVQYVNKLKQMTQFNIYSFNSFVYRRKKVVLKWRR